MHRRIHSAEDVMDNIIDSLQSYAEEFDYECSFDNYSCDITYFLLLCYILIYYEVRK